MTIDFEHVPLTADDSFTAYDYRMPVIGHPFHVHEEYELVSVSGQGGVVYCGAESRPFYSGDLFFFAGRLPHRFEGRPVSGSSSAIARVIQFRKDALGRDFFSLPENRCLRDLMRRASDGLVLPQTLSAFDAAEDLADIIAARGPLRLIGLLSVLAKLSTALEQERLEILSPGAGRVRTQDLDAQRLSRLQDFIESKYASEANLDAAAEALALTRTSLCRYVKRMTGRSFTELVNDYRLTVAAIKLRDPSVPVSTIAADVGFGSLSHFNARFKERFALTPSDFRRGAEVGVSRDV